MPLLPHRDSPRRKRWIRRYTFGAVIILGGVITWFAGPSVKQAYQGWKKDRALTQAETFLATQDYPNAKLALDVALAAKPGDPETLKVAADLLEQVGAPEVMPLRRRLVQATPDEAESHAALVMSALRFNDLNAARDAMRAMTPEQANEPVALRAALAYAQATNNLPIADVLYGRLREVEPDNENLQVLHATLRLNNPTPEIRAEALAELETLRTRPRHTLFILRTLMVDAMSRQDSERATQLADLLTQDERATFTDHLHRANLALNVEKRPFADVFAELLPVVASTPQETAEFLRWLILVGEADRAQLWLQERSSDLTRDSVVTEVRAELAVAQATWDQLANLLENGAWGPVNRDTVRLAFSARLAADRENLPLHKQIWDEALISAANSLADLTLLYRLASIWEWDSLAETTLWAIARAFPSRSWAHQTLFNAYRQRRDTESMQALIGTLRIADPTTPRYQYDWALLSMLLRPRNTWTAEKQAMQTLHESAPDNSYYITGYAFALAQSDRTDDALTLLEKLPPRERALPERAPYLAYIYAAAMQPAEVDTIIAGAADHENYLPEELALLHTARERVR